MWAAERGENGADAETKPQKRYHRTAGHYGSRGGTNSCGRSAEDGACPAGVFAEEETTR